MSRVLVIRGPGSRVGLIGDTFMTDVLVAEPLCIPYKTSFVLCHYFDVILLMIKVPRCLSDVVWGGRRHVVHNGCCGWIKSLIRERGLT